MSTYDDIFQQLVKAAYQGNLNDTITKIHEAQYETPADNPFVLQLLDRLGYNTLEALLSHESMFTRKL